MHNLPMLLQALVPFLQGARAMLDGLLAFINVVAPRMAYPVARV
jgi:hypothetical protein